MRILQITQGGGVKIWKGLKSSAIEGTDSVTIFSGDDDKLVKQVDTYFTSDYDLPQCESLVRIPKETLELVAELS